MSIDTPSFDDRIANRMKQILLAKGAVCGAGGIGVEVLRSELLDCFPSDEHEAVKLRFFHLKKTPPFKTFAENGLVLTCFDPPREIRMAKVTEDRPATTDEIVDTIYFRLNSRLFKKDILAVLHELRTMITEHLTPPPIGPGKFTIHGLCSFEVEKQEDASVVVVHPHKSLQNAITGSSGER
ncbi:MAG: hypothetical protein ACF788_04300 [Novipirellula sp. JB048]